MKNKRVLIILVTLAIGFLLLFSSMFASVSIKLPFGWKLIGLDWQKNCMIPEGCVQPPTNIINSPFAEIDSYSSCEINSRTNLLGCLPDYYADKARVNNAAIIINKFIKYVLTPVLFVISFITLAIHFYFKRKNE